MKSRPVLALPQALMACLFLSLGSIANSQDDDTRRSSNGLANGGPARGYFSQPSRYAAEDDFPKVGDRSGNLSFVAGAVQSGDPAQIADAALLVAEAERVLDRTVETVSARTLFDAALQAATARHDSETLDRLERAADRLGDGDFKTRIVTARKLSAVARNEADGIAIPIADIDTPAFAYAKWLQQRAYDAKVWRNPQLIAPLEWAVESPGRVPVPLRAPLERLLDDTRNALKEIELPSSGGLDALTRLAAPSRSHSILGRWRSGGRVVDFDNSGWMEIQAANGNTAVFQYDIDDTTANPDFWVLTVTDKTGYTSRGIIQWLDEDSFVWRGDIGALTYRRIQ